MDNAPNPLIRFAFWYLFAGDMYEIYLSVKFQVQSFIMLCERLAFVVVENIMFGVIFEN